VAHAVISYGRIQRLVVNEESAHEYAEQQRLNAEAAGWDAKAHVRPLVYGDAAPQASEAVDRSPNLQGSQVDESAELQGIASEAVRDARAEGFQAGLDKALEVLEHDDFATRMQSAQVIRSLKSQSAALSAQPAAEPLSNPKQFALTGTENIRAGAPYDDPAFEALCREHGIWGTAQSALCAVFWRQAGQQRAAGDERTAFEATYQADYDDPGVACEREHFGKGYRAGLSAQSAKEQGESDA